MHTQTHIEIAQNIRQGLDCLVRDALEVSCLPRHTLRGAEALLDATPVPDGDVPFSNVSS